MNQRGSPEPRLTNPFGLIDTRKVSINSSIKAHLVISSIIPSDAYGDETINTRMERARMFYLTNAVSSIHLADAAAAAGPTAEQVTAELQAAKAHRAAAEARLELEQRKGGQLEPLGVARAKVAGGDGVELGDSARAWHPRVEREPARARRSPRRRARASARSRFV